MDKQTIDTLDNTAEEFGSIAKKVNESSRKRKTHSEEALKFINLCLEVGDKIKNGINTVYATNKKIRNQDTIVSNTCSILKANITKQKQLIDELVSESNIDNDISKDIIEKNDALSDAITKTKATIDQIIVEDNKILLLDEVLSRRKEDQQEEVKELKGLAEKSLEDAKKAIEGSSSNLERGLAFVERFKDVEALVNDGKTDKLKDLMNGANMGWNIAVDVNKSSRAQLQFAEEVNHFTEILHEDSIAIKNIIGQKHNIFEGNLQTVTVLTVLISMKFKKYLTVEESIEKLKKSEGRSNALNNLLAYMEAACSDIEELATINYDMTDISHKNNEIETESHDLSKKELEYFDNIKIEVSSMTEATKYPIEGSDKNITNGKILEEALQGVIDSM